MNHEDVLNQLLANSCDVTTGDNDLRLFSFDLGCTFAYIVARFLDINPIKYEILYLDIRNWASDEAYDKAYDFMRSL